MTGDVMVRTRAYREWLVEKALPFWVATGFDELHGRFFERVDLTGRPLPSVPHRALVQARQIYVFAHAAVLGWFPQGGKIAEIAMLSLLRDFRDPSSKTQGFAFSVDQNGTIVSAVRDAYTQAFVLLAIAWLFRLNGEQNLLTIADETIQFIDTCLEDKISGGLFDMFPVTDQSKRQNPHMHLLEAYLALEKAAPGQGYIDRAAKLTGLLKNRFFHSEHGVLLEYFAADWGKHPDPLKCDVFEPGHHFEWVWLLHEYAKLTREDLSFWIEQLGGTARKHGLTKDGLIFDELAADLSVRKNSHRVWPHTEAIKAAICGDLQRDRDAADFAAQMVQSLMENFLAKPFAGGWIDQLTAKREPLVNYVPASSLYHLFVAGSELSRVFNL